MQTKYITCESCGVETAKRGNGPQKYCEPCSATKNAERGLAWSRKNPLTKAQLAKIRDNRTADLSRVVEVCNRRSEANRGSISWMASPGPDLEWCVRIAVPFSYSLSKNHIFTRTRFGHTALRREARASREEITALMRQAVREVEIKNNKLWIDLFVEKPNHRGDAVNVLDLVCDAIKDATGVDDRWYSLRRVDWSIVKTQPTMYIGIGQEECVDSIACSSCGSILPLDAFNKNKSASIGVTRRCRACMKASRKGEPAPELPFEQMPAAEALDNW